MKRPMFNLSWLLAAGALAMLPAAFDRTVAAAADEDDVTLVGCLLSGEGDDGYVLTNVADDIPSARRGAVTPGPVGTSSGSMMTTFYWLEDDDALKAHVGHRVEIMGDLKDDVDEGEIELDRKDSWTNLHINSDGRDLTVRLPQSIVVLSKTDDDQKFDVLVRRVDVDKVRMIGASCS